jgi:hypothetical protein
MKLLKIPYQKALDVLALYSANNDFSLLAEDTMTPYELIQVALEQSLHADIVCYLAHALPVREAVWWAYCCTNNRDDWNPQEWDAIRATKAWVHTPDETNRRFAEAMALKAGLDSGAGWAAQSAFWSGGSITRPNEPIVPPPQYLYAQAVAGCIDLSAVLPEGQLAIERYQHFIDIGFDIAKGGNGDI